MTLDELADLHGRHAHDTQRELRTVLSIDVILRLCDLVASLEAMYETLQPTDHGRMRAAACRSALEALGCSDRLIDRMKAARDEELSGDRPIARN